ncbi:DUF11 domain-containing protein [Streptacidiphilus melanogenes]|uniref:DUF11 domain-containing protein n=1 Tax=Streptacidiphilus melanogenes TaxID=411235 RepID=UPI0005A928DE|nr:DUF11 domain-containing protein [Streptacidiphilus melanogenes]
MAKPNANLRQAVVPGLDLSVGKSHIGPFRQGQHNATYMITVSNLGSVPAFGLFSVTDSLPPSMTATSISGVGWDCTLATLTCDRAPGPLLSATDFPTIYLTVNVADDAPGFATNTATLTASVNGRPPIVTTVTDPTRILSGNEDRDPGKGGRVDVKIDNHNSSAALNLNHTSAHAGAHQGQGQGQGQSQSTSVKTKVNTKLHAHNSVVVGKSRHHRHHHG